MMDEKGLFQQCGVIISGFINGTDELRDKAFPEFKIIMKSNIYDYIQEDDPDYAQEYKDSLKNAAGIYYIAKDNSAELIICDRDIINIILSIPHEITHLFDYTCYSDYYKEKNIRKIQEISYFRLWSEFHAEYLTYCYLIRNGGNFDTDDMIKRWENILKENILSEGYIELYKILDISVRIFGAYIALYDTYSEKMPRIPNMLYINEKFSYIYFYLYEHRTFDSIKDNLKELENVFMQAETKRKIDWKKFQ